MGLYQRVSASSPTTSIPSKQQAAKKIKLLFFLILSLASTLALFGAFKRETTYLDRGLFVDSKNGGEDYIKTLYNDASISNKVSEDELVFVPGEEWAGSISATHAPEHSGANTHIEEQKQDADQPLREDIIKLDDKEEGLDEDNSSDPDKAGVDEGDDYVRDGVVSHNDNDYDYSSNPDEGGADIDEEYMYNPKDFESPPKISNAENRDEEDNFDEETTKALEYLRDCTTLECIKKAHKKLHGKTKFNAPHFFLIGFQKCATTSVNHYLRGHPEYLPSVLKEAHYFTACRKSWNDSNCKANSTQDYIENYLRIKDAAENRLETATVDASVDYAWKGEDLAREIHKVFPWLKIVVMIREPISRVISYTRMWTQKGIRTSTHNENRIACDNGEELFDCLYPHLTPTAYTGHYAIPLEGWLKVWPADQIHVIQFEEFVSNTDAVMRRLKKFLGMDPTLPEDVQLYNVNTRKDSGDAPMKKRQYRTLVEMARPDSEKVANLLHKYGLANRKEWMGRWQSVWDQVLNSCNASRICMVNSN